MEGEDLRKVIVEKMLDAAMKEKFQQLARKYDRKAVFDIWVKMARNGGAKPYTSKLTWKAEWTIARALDYLDNYLSSLEMQMQKSLPEEKG